MRHLLAMTSLSQLLQPFMVGSSTFLKNRAKNGKVCSVGLCACHLSKGMRGYANNWRANARAGKDRPDIASRQVIAGQVGTVRSASKSYVSAGVDQKLRLRVPKSRHGLLRKLFQHMRTQILFPKLNPIHSCGRTFSNLREQLLLLTSAISGEETPVRNVVKAQGH